ncbi:MAG: CHASE domain-containing protein [Bacteroidota bacterium]|nr:CHASE domain-containing protein [Bacteroidota bacterium]
MKIIKTNSFFKTYSLALFSFFALFAITLVIYSELTYRTESRLQQYFFVRTERTEIAILQRMNYQIQILKGSRGLFAASDTITKVKWKIYYDNLNLNESLSGMQGLGYAPYITDENLDNFLLKVENASQNSFKVFPEGKRDVITPILFLEPKDNRNSRAIGFDMYSEPKRREAMNRALKNNAPSITTKIKLIQEIENNEQPGIIIYLPVYKNNSIPELFEDRKKQIQGFIYSPFRMIDLMKATLGGRFNDIHIKIYDGNDIEESSLLFDNYPEEDQNKNFTKVSSIVIAGNTWKIHFSTLPSFSDTHQVQPLIILGGGTVISLLVFFFMWSLVNQRYANDLRKVITENATAGLFMMDDKGFCTFMNPAAEELTGYTFDEIRQQPLHNIIHHTKPDGSPYPIEECPIDRALPTNNAVRAHEDVFVHKDGSFYQVTCAARPIIKNGKPISTVFEVRNITSEKLSQQELKDAKNKLEVSEAHYRSIAEGMPVLVWTAATNGTIEYCNKRWYDYTGYSNLFTSALESRKNVFHPDEEAQDFNMWMKAIKEETQYENQHRIRRHDGQFRWHLSRALPLKNKKGRIQKWFVTSTDIHEQVLQNEELLKINNDLDNFVYTASHDLKAPISNLEGLMELIYSATEDKLNSKEKKIFNMVNITINKFKNTILDLTEITKIQKQTSEDIEIIFFEDEINDVKTQIQKMIDDSDATIITEFKIPAVSFSKKNLHSIFYNLVSNAIKYRSPQRSPIIKVDSYEENGFIILRVQDNGLGIDPSKQDKLFGMFKRLHDHVEGTGIGLYIVKRILENSEGKIEVESKLNEGTTFKAYFKKELTFAPV